MCKAFDSAHDTSKQATSRRGPSPPRQRPNPHSQGSFFSWRFTNAPQKRIKEACQRPGPPYKGSSPDPRPERSNNNDVELSIDHESTRAIVARSNHLAINELQTILDPFCPLSTDLTEGRQQLLQFYLTAIPVTLYGTRPNSIFCPVRDVSFAMSQTSPLTLRWMLIAAEALIARRRCQTPPSSLFRQKSLAYRALYHALLVASEGNISEDFISGMIMATVIESRISAPEVPDVHLKGYEKAIRIRGLRKSILGSSCPFLYTGHLMTYMASEPPEAALVLGEESMEHAMELLYHFAQGESMVEPADLCFTTDPLSSPLASSPVPLEKTCAQAMQTSLTARLLAPFLQPELWTYGRYSMKSAHFVSLFLIVSTLWTLQRDLISSKIFLARLNLLLNKTSLSDSKTGQNLLTLEGLMWIVIKAAFDIYDSRGDKRGRVQDQADLIVNAASALKLFRVCHEKVRQKMICFLCRCLSNDCDSALLIVDDPLKMRSMELKQEVGQHQAG